jgi:hypothetical protein
MHSYARFSLSIVEAEMQKVRELTLGAGKIKTLMSRAQASNACVVHSSQRLPGSHGSGSAAIQASVLLSTEADACSFSQSDQIDYVNVSRLSRNTSYDLIWRRFKARS